VTVRVADDELARVSAILERHKPIDLDERGTKYGVEYGEADISRGTTHSPSVGVRGLEAAANDSDKLQLKAEALSVSKRAVSGGTTRIRRYVVETPVPLNCARIVFFGSHWLGSTDKEEKMSAAISRRSALLSLSVCWAWTPRAFAAPGPGGVTVLQNKFKSIRVDTSPLDQNGDRSEAQWLSQDLPPLLQNAFTAHLTPRDPAADVLVVRIDLITLGAWTGSANLWNSRPIDSIQGVGLVLSARGALVASYPLLSTGQTTIFVSELGDIALQRRRVAEMAQSFAYWLPRQMGL
jgi:hypothetical protein